MTASSELVVTLAGAESLAPAWDALAEAAGRPYCAPGWLLPWWRHVAPRGSQLRVVAVREGDELIGLAPFHVFRWRGLPAYSLLGTNLSSRVEPLVREGHAEEATRAFAAALAGARPTPAVVHLWGVPAASRWPERLAEAWPGPPPLVHRRSSVAAPTVTLGAGDVDAWLRGRSTNFRGQMRRFRRRLEDAGAVFRVTERPEDVDADLAEFERLHSLRFADRGGSDAFPPGAREMLREAGRNLLPSRRFRLASIEIDGRPIASHLFVAAGSEISFWNTGFDDAYGHLRPSYIGLVDAVAAGFEDGYARLDLGVGEQDYKYRFADSEDQLEWAALIPRTGRSALARAAYAPDQLRYAITTRLEPDQKERLRHLANRVRRRKSG